MVGFDLPHVAHDMILRFMGVDFSVIAHNGGMDSTAHLPSSLGGDVKPVLDAADNGSGGGSAGSGSGVGSPDKEAPSPSVPEVDNTALWQSEIHFSSRL